MAVLPEADRRPAPQVASHPHPARPGLRPASSLMKLSYANEMDYPGFILRLPFDNGEWLKIYESVM